MKAPLITTILFATLLGCKKDDSLVMMRLETDAIERAHSDKKMEICHKGETIVISTNAWPAHQKHGDAFGNCQTYITTTICDQTWMVRNLEVDKYRNGDPIPQVTDPVEWASLTTGAWCYYLNKESYGPVLGKLYNWFAVNDPRGLAPEGWHIPSHEEWQSLIECLGGWDVAGGKLKQSGTALWLPPNTDATNESGFTALPGGQRNQYGEFMPTTDEFLFIGTFGDWWTTSEYLFESSIYGRDKYIVFNSGSVQDGANDKKYGYSVRCVRD